jgi:hypothetical protein
MHVSADSGVMDTASLKRSDVTVADRARWLPRLRWPNECEYEFAQTHLTDDGGLEFHLLQPGLSFVIVRCALGAYQPTSVVILLDERPPVPTSTVLSFPTFDSADGKTLTPARTAELVGEIAVLDGHNSLTVLSKARQIGDCGTWARYEFKDGAPVLAGFAERVACPESGGAPANPKAGEPPKGWRKVIPP